MSILRFFRPVKDLKEDVALDPNGPLSTVVPSTGINSVNNEIRKINSVEKEIRKEKQSEIKTRGEYLKTNNKEKVRVAKYASENGIMSAVRHFKDMDLKEATVRGWKKAYENELKRMHQSGADVVSELPVKKRGRPPLLGEKSDTYLQKIIADMRERGAPVGTSVIVGIGRGILLKMSKT